VWKKPEHSVTMSTQAPFTVPSFTVRKRFQASSYADPRLFIGTIQLAESDVCSTNQQFSRSPAGSRFHSFFSAMNFPPFTGRAFPQQFSSAVSGSHDSLIKSSPNLPPPTPSGPTSLDWSTPSYPGPQRFLHQPMQLFLRRP
jgi:hypothetical protein